MINSLDRMGWRKKNRIMVLNTEKSKHSYLGWALFSALSLHFFALFLNPFLNQKMPQSHDSSIFQIAFNHAANPSAFSTPSLPLESSAAVSPSLSKKQNTLQFKERKKIPLQKITSPTPQIASSLSSEEKTASSRPQNGSILSGTPQLTTPTTSPMNTPKSSGVSRPASYRLGSAHTPLPPYPPLARLRGIEGTVVLNLSVNEEGFCQTVSILKSSGSPLLDEAASTTVQKWRVQPAIHQGEPIASQLKVRLHFKLSSASEPMSE